MKIPKETEMKLCYLIPSLDVFVIKIRRVINEAGEYFYVDFRTKDGKGETEGMLVCEIFGKIPSKGNIKKRIIEYLKLEEAKEKNEN